jgi:hypothetical protein
LHGSPRRGIGLLEIVELPIFATISRIYSTKASVGVRTIKILDKLEKTPNFDQNIQFFGTFSWPSQEGHSTFLEM